MRRKALVLLAGTAWLLGAVVPLALAHSYVRTVEPAPGSTVPPPGTIRMSFTFPIKKAESKATLTGPGDASVALRPTEAGEPNDLIFLVPADAPLAPGAYRVEWEVVSADGHAQKGDFTFTVAADQGSGAATKPPAPGAAPGATAAPAAPAATGGPTGATGSLWPWLVAGAVIGVAAGLIRVLRLRRRGDG